ncbi:MAG: type II toxin-antitoxin system HipA family toxin [Planctomycetes bacterium]|nr:type II toxin-antitoxin system HipA family toxin [Planctomycetota bacterium]
MTVAEVRLWGRTVGAVAVEGKGEFASFEFTPDFASSGIQLAPLTMPLGNRVWQFAELPRATFHGLPGLLADSLPDRFGNAVIDAWLAAQGRLPGDIDPVERLCYTGTRGMGALEFRPARGPQAGTAQPIRIDALVELAGEVLRSREALQASFADPQKEHALREILRVGASAGGARAKAVVAWNPTTNEVRSGQVRAPSGFEYWLLKFDGVGGGNPADLGDTRGYGAIEFAYSQMAKAAGLQMSECRLFEENGRRHFMTRRFDRQPSGDKLHMQSLGALAHFDFNAPGAHSYEQALAVVHRLGLPMAAKEELFRRMVFNVVARNQDDHVKNIAFLMDRLGQWSLAPAFDVAFSHDPEGGWTQHHQMSLAGKRDGFTVDDLLAVAKTAAMKRGRAEAILAEVTAAVQQWRTFATAAGVPRARSDAIAGLHRLAW